MIADRFLSHLEGVRSTGQDRWLARCPAHNDQNPSLSIDDKDGKLFVYCHAGCSQDEVIDALKAKGLWTTGRGVSGCVINPFS